MRYSLARFRKLNPSLPCLVGGQFLVLNDRTFLRDAHEARELLGPRELFSQLRTGDQALVKVVEQTGDGLACATAECLVRCQGEPSDLRAGHAPEFARFQQSVREFFLRRGFDEVATPTLVQCPGLEPSLEPFAVEISTAPDRRTVYLPTSPEIHLKQALCRGWTDIFALRPCFRRGEFSPHHAGEFQMLEWYRGFADLELILCDLQDLLAHLLVERFSTQAVTLQVTTFAQLFREVLNFTLRPSTTLAELRELCVKFAIEINVNDTFDDLFHRLLIARLEPRLKTMGAVVVRDFPPSQAALARLMPSGWADRFEFYWRGLEIANAFNEVNDPQEQRRRWQADQRERARLGTTFLEPDENLLHALDRGMPPAGGIALGLERLFMAMKGIENIRELRLFASEEGF